MDASIVQGIEPKISNLIITVRVSLEVLINIIKLYYMELIASIYCLIGFLIGIHRLSICTEDEDSSILCLVATTIIIAWPIYLIYKYFNRNN